MKNINERINAIAMEVKDINGKTIKVTDLPAAIEQADAFRGFRHEDETFKDFDDKQNRYWDDIYHKLLELKKQSDEHTIL